MDEKGVDELARKNHWKQSLVELLLVGGATPILFLLSFAIRKTSGLDPAEYAIGFLMFHAAYVINDPHFTVTYLLFYKDARARALGDHFDPLQRIRYVLAGVVAPIGLGGWIMAALATKSAFALGLLIQLMFLLVGWHYVKQGFGVFTVLAARRGVRFSARERLVVLLHCYAGWAYAWASPAETGRELEEKGLVFKAIAHGPTLELVTQIVCLSTVIPLIWVLVRKWRSEGRLPILTPLVALLCGIWPWSIYAGVDPLVRYMVPALHSIQYLYFVWLLKGNEAKDREGPPFFERSARTRLAILALSAIGLGILVFHAGPSALDGVLVPRKVYPELGSLGPTPYFAAMYAFVNIHHYLMDAVIWRRENPETRYLQDRAWGEGERIAAA